MFASCPLVVPIAARPPLPAFQSPLDFLEPIVPSSFVKQPPEMMRIEDANVPTLMVPADCLNGMMLGGTFE